jgi:hypothetical protein
MGAFNFDIIKVILIPSLNTSQFGFFNILFSYQKAPQKLTKAVPPIKMIVKRTTNKVDVSNIRLFSMFSTFMCKANAKATAPLIPLNHMMI